MKTSGVAMTMSLVLCGFVTQTQIARGAEESDTVLHIFAGPTTDGRAPYAGLIHVGNKLYGTTRLGGTGTNCGPAGCGTIFDLSEQKGTWTYNPLYSFAGGADGSWPVGALTNVNGTLYGTTVYGGMGKCKAKSETPGCGTVFSIGPDGTNHTVIYSFGYENGDGDYPMSALIYPGHTLYGTTYNGGANGTGTLFSISPSGRSDTVLHSFGKTDSGDGYWPEQSVINVGGTLYGMTDHGGGGGCTTGCGMIFSYSASKGYKQLYSFQGNGQDGTFPAGAFVNVSGTLYGTTYEGGTSTNCSGGCGTVFSYDPAAGKEVPLYSFENGTDGSNPLDTLIDVGVTLYGTALLGGNQNCEGGCGTIFSIGTNGTKYATVYAFCGASCNPVDGNNPYAGLIPFGGELYGTTLYGGNTKCLDHGCGTVFQLPANR